MDNHWISWNVFLNVTFSTVLLYALLFRRNIIIDSDSHKFIYVTSGVTAVTIPPYGSNVLYLKKCCGFLFLAINTPAPMYNIFLLHYRSWKINWPQKCVQRAEKLWFSKICVYNALRESSAIIGILRGELHSWRWEGVMSSSSSSGWKRKSNKNVRCYNHCHRYHRRYLHYRSTIYYIYAYYYSTIPPPRPYG